MGREFQFADRADSRHCSAEFKRRKSASWRGFVHTLPAMISRKQWDGRPYLGTPTAAASTVQRNPPTSARPGRLIEGNVYASRARTAATAVVIGAAISATALAASTSPLADNSYQGLRGSLETASDVSAARSLDATSALS
jgi:hypothetical protein